jgi:hypothetical protein
MAGKGFAMRFLKAVLGTAMTPVSAKMMLCAKLLSLLPVESALQVWWQQRMFAWELFRLEVTLRTQALASHVA